MTKILVDNYTLQVGERGKERLTILNRIYNPASEQFLLASGLRTGMKVLEVGCGTGEITCWLAKQVGVTGKVVAVDQSEAQLTITEKTVQAAGISNVSYVAMAVHDLNQLNESFDLIYSRWLLMHLRNPFEALQIMYDCLKPNGILTCEDGAKEGCFCYPASTVFDQWLAAWAHRFTYYKKDYNSGLKLPTLFARLNCRIEQLKLFQPILHTSQEKSVIALNAEESIAAIVDSGFLTLEETYHFIEALKNLTNEQYFIGYLRNTQIAGRKP